MPIRRVLFRVACIGLMALALTAFDEWRQPTLPPWNENSIGFIDKQMIIGAMVGVVWTMHRVRDPRDGRVCAWFQSNHPVGEFQGKMGAGFSAEPRQNRRIDWFWRFGHRLNQSR